ncbi:hypothetical protein ACFWY6_16300 [Streptomyces sp. NPDC059037]|uniref:hypothetical protein n=1 Tax=Streptomyces sp. NPDC059037 TaxID=3346710 RepID=UPI003681B47F
MDLDSPLLGHWSSLPFSYGVMEASELGLLGDGRGWSAWFNANALSVTRLTWRCPRPGVVELHTRWSVQGTISDGPGPLAFATTEPVERLDEVTCHRYVIEPAIPMPGADPLMAINFEEPVEFCDQYARGPREIGPEDDPSHLVRPYR